MSLLLNKQNGSTSRYFNNIKESNVYKKYQSTKTNKNSCGRNDKCRKNTTKYNNKKKLTNTKAKVALNTLTYKYKKKIIDKLTTMLGFIKSSTKQDIVDISNYLDILDKVYNDPLCNSGISISTMPINSGYRNSYSKKIDIYQYLIEQMKIQLPKLALPKIQLFINNIKDSKLSKLQDLDYEDIMNNTTFKKILILILQKMLDCKNS